MGYRLAFFGDDFTGSTDALETLEEMGLEAVLFTEVPTMEQLEVFVNKQAIGIAGMTRTLSVHEIETELKKVFGLFSQIDIGHFHYKVCSTFDSSPEVGSIGKAIDLAAEAFEVKLVPLIVGAPYLGRFCAFGNLFARMGTGPTGDVFRLDRHPSMSKHPVTPVTESDLRIHLAKQTAKEISLVDVTQLNQPATEIATQINEMSVETRIVLFDVMSEQHLEKIGDVLDILSQACQPLFSVGSSAVSKALCASWSKTGVLSPRKEWPRLKAAKPLLVLSGSCSVVTGRQIEHALSNGFASVPVDGAELLSTSNEMYVQAIIEKVLGYLRQDKSVVVHTSIGPEDTRVGDTRTILKQRGVEGYEANLQTATLYGKALADIADQVTQSFVLERLVIAGGDTSSLFAREFGIDAVEMVSPIAPGAPLCRIHSKKSHVDGLTINFKGGQVGEVDYFLRMESGSV